jgi:hypothetical protein
MLYFNKNEFFIEQMSKDVANEMIIKYHYSHKATSNRYSFGLYHKNNTEFIGFKLVGTIIYGYPVGRRVGTSICDTIGNKNVLELTRLYIHDEYGKNIESHFISQTIKKIKKLDDKIKIIISYSDPEQNHLGIIYQATNFYYQGNNTMLVDGITIKETLESDWMHPRSVVAKFGSANLNIIKEKLGHDFYIKNVAKKHRYIYIIPKGKERINILKTLKHKILPYPKKNEYTENIQLIKI